MPQPTDDTPGATDEAAREKAVALMRKARIAMLTTVAPDGSLVAKPMATQEVESDGDLYFICERDSDKARNIASHPHVNVAYSGDSSWVSLAGRAEVVNDVAKLSELWGAFTGAWLEGGPDNDANVLIRVEADGAEYWDSPGAKVTQLANLLKSKVTGRRFEGDNESVDL